MTTRIGDRRQRIKRAVDFRVGCDIIWDMREIAPHITIDPTVRFGKPVIKGTRVPVHLIVGKVAGGMTPEDVAREYELKKADVLAALRYAAEVVQQEQLMYA